MNVTTQELASRRDHILTVVFAHLHLLYGSVNEHVERPQHTHHSDEVKGDRAEDLPALAGGHVQLLPLRKQVRLFVMLCHGHKMTVFRWL